MPSICCIFWLGAAYLEVTAITMVRPAERPLENAAVVALRFDDGTVGTMCCGRRMPDYRK